MFLELFDLTQPLTFASVLTGLLVIWVANMVNYFMLTAPAYFWYWRRTNVNAVRIQSGEPFPGQIRHEIYWSMVSIVIFTVLTTALIIAWRLGAFPLTYMYPSERGWLYFFVGIVLVILVQDVCFYWTHRLLHTRKLIRYHGVHHRSKLPTPFVMYAFHPVEATLHYVRILVILLLVPTCPLMLIITEGFISNIVNVYGHLNHEPRWMRYFGFLHRNTSSTSVYHDLHHGKVRGNYGFYLKIWDRLFGTMIPETEANIAKVHQQWQEPAPTR